MLWEMLQQKKCRPLLNEEPELRAVREVKNLIVWLNDESEIEANFSASFNSSSLGNVARQSRNRRLLAFSSSQRKKKQRLRSKSARQIFRLQRRRLLRLLLSIVRQ